MKSRLAILLMLALFCGAAFASGAPWYAWRSKMDGTLLCTQISPGEAWYKYRGPYMESHCRKAGNPQ